MDTWQYARCKVLRVIDADTLEMDLDQGMRQHCVGISVRLKDCYAPERGTPEGLVAANFVRELLAAAKSIKVVSHKWEWSFNRVVATVLVDDISLAQILIDNQYATATQT